MKIPFAGFFELLMPLRCLELEVFTSRNTQPGVGPCFSFRLGIGENGPDPAEAKATCA